MDAKLWNVGMKVKDVDSEAAFFVALGGQVLIREQLSTPDGKVDYALVAFGATRIFMTPKTLFEDRLPHDLHHGLTHAVFEVDQLDPEVERLKALGTEVLIPPMEITAAFGTRKIAFFRSPGGLVFELMQILSGGAAD
jgi:catechol 2,3-dioxygenase-like lactoylglutathione lyase family enzyme